MGVGVGVGVTVGVGVGVGGGVGVGVTVGVGGGVGVGVTVGVGVPEGTVPALSAVIVLLYTGKFSVLPIIGTENVNVYPEIVTVAVPVLTK